MFTDRTKEEIEDQMDNKLLEKYKIDKWLYVYKKFDKLLGGQEIIDEILYFSREYNIYNLNDITIESYEEDYENSYLRMSYSKEKTEQELIAETEAAIKLQEEYAANKEKRRLEKEKQRITQEKATLTRLKKKYEGNQ